MAFSPPSIPPDEHLGELLRLPNEILDTIASHLSNRDIKKLRLTCRSLCEKAHLRLSRVFISANPRNIEVLYSIANHERFRMNVTEIIWDDATLTKWWTSEEYRMEGDDEMDEWERWDQWDDKHECPRWFAEACCYELDAIRSRKGFDGPRPEHIAREKIIKAKMPLAACWKVYQQLLDEQDDVMISKSDAHAFRYALERFPSLKRVSVTPATHGFLFTPLYETPMIRSLPYGLVYSIPRGWPYAGDCENDPEAPLWIEDGEQDADQEKIRDQWRGFRIVINALTQKDVQHCVSEFVLDVHGLSTGLNCHLFDQTCDDYDRFATLLRQPGFHHLHLSLLVGGLEGSDWKPFRGGLLRRALTGARDLRHFQFCNNFDVELDVDSTNSDGTRENEVPLRSIFPIEQWPRLRHFGLSGFIVDHDDLLSLLSQLPPTLRSVELSFLQFFSGQGDYRSLLYDMRDKLDWRGRAPEERPKVVIGLNFTNKRPGRAIWVREWVERFIYGDGQNPFGHEDGTQGHALGIREAGVIRDEFEPAHERRHKWFGRMERAT